MPEAKGGWRLVGPSALPFSADYPMPEELNAEGIEAVRQAFVTAARRAYAAGFRVVELHAAHGYLFHEFLSPLSNRRTDAYGGSFDNRTRLLRDCVSAVRAAWPESCPLFVRISATDWTEGGWDIDQSVELARRLKSLGVDVIDCSSGGNVEKAAIPVGPGYQLPFAERIRREAGIMTAAVGMITRRPRPTRSSATARPISCCWRANAARSLLAAARRARTRTRNDLAGAIFASGAARLEGARARPPDRLRRLRLTPPCASRSGSATPRRRWSPRTAEPTSTPPANCSRGPSSAPSARRRRSGSKSQSAS